MWTASLIILAFILDCILGDPPNPWHPVRLLGKVIAGGAALCQKIRLQQTRLHNAVRFVAGMLLSLTVVGLAYGVTGLLTWGCYSLNTWVGFAVETGLCYFLIAPRALKDESMKVYHAVAAADVAGARKNLARIVGRDTHTLDFPAIIKATVETVAENLSDGVIAPLLFILIGGAPLGMAYKAINTLDSMLGYRSEEWEYVGKFAARLDDAANFIPARAAALMMLLACWFTGAPVKRAARIYWRDRYKHKSPNSGQTESVCAGALGLCLGGESSYQGVRVRKPTLGDNLREPVPEDIVAANWLMYAATLSAIGLMALGGLLL
jgi:adenosylcobinamide-phosphate synthase